MTGLDTIWVTGDPSADGSSGEIWGAPTEAAKLDFAARETYTI